MEANYLASLSLMLFWNQTWVSSPRVWQSQSTDSTLWWRKVQLIARCQVRLLLFKRPELPSGFCMHALSLQPSLTLCNPMDYNLTGFSVHRIFQARILEWITINYPRGSSWPGKEPMCLLHLLNWQASSLPLGPLGRPQYVLGKGF